MTTKAELEQMMAKLPKPRAKAGRVKPKVTPRRNAHPEADEQAKVIEWELRRAVHRDEARRQQADAGASEVFAGVGGLRVSGGRVLVGARGNCGYPGLLRGERWRELQWRLTTEAGGLVKAIPRPS